MNNITDIGEGGSNIWAYNIQQSLRVSSNCTIGGYLQAKGLAVGTSDDSVKSKRVYTLAVQNPITRAILQL